MYVSPRLTRFGSMQELTLAGCTGASDSATIGDTTSIGNIPTITIGGDGIATTEYCFVQVS
jgi:hypothetical protein